MRYGNLYADKPPCLIPSYLLILLDTHFDFYQSLNIVGIFGKQDGIEHASVKNHGVAAFLAYIIDRFFQLFEYWAEQFLPFFGKFG